MIRYIVLCQEGQADTRYDIAAVRGSKQIQRITGIFPTMEQTLALAEILQDHGVSVEHFHDIVEDYIVSSAK